MSFVNLHGHSHYSLLDGFGSPASIVKRAKELGYPAVALTDHGVVYGLIEFYKAAKKEGVKPILGCELYVAPRTRFDKTAKIDNKPYHLTTLAKNNTGYENLLKLVSKAHLEGFYYKPRVDYDLLEEHSEGLIVLSGCMAAHLPRLIVAGNEKESRALIEKFIGIFGKENYFLEIQDNPLMESQLVVNAKLKEYAKEFGLGLVATLDSHYPKPDDKDVHDILLCIQTQTNVDDQNRMKYVGDFSLRSVDELRVAFEDCPEAIENSLKIAEMCNVEFEFGTNLIPSYDTPDNMKAEDYLRKLCEEGLEKRFEGNVPDGYMERLNYELETVNSMGFDTYFLIVYDFVRYAKENGIVVGPGRGSAAGSIIAWCLNITDMDPLKYGLFFERFLNPERVSMPDIDIDFADHRRGEVLEYVVDKYGKSNFAQIITFGTMAPKAAIRDAGRALGYPYSEVDEIAKAVPPAVLGKYAPLNSSIEDDKALRDIYEGNPRAKVLLDYARKLEGTVRHVGTHACAVVISEKPLTNYTALQYGAGDGDEIVTQYSMKPLESLGLLKMDFLGLRNLTIIERTIEIVQGTRGIEIDLENLPMDDDATFKTLQKGDTTGVFQLESGGMRRYLKELKPTKFEDIVAMGALYRPGPMEWIPNYIKGKHNPDSVQYLHESFKEILEPTYGVAVYQEQILQLARDFAGFTLGEADILRKAVGKKDPALLAEQRQKFIAGAVESGYKEKFAKEVFEKVVEPFAGYGFNKAHAVCYGMIAYQTAYLKAHFPTEFMTALLCSDASNTDRVVLEIKECAEMGISVSPPSVNFSFSNFTYVSPTEIRFGLQAIKGVGEGPIQKIIDAREDGGKFKSIEDFARRVPATILNKKLIQSLAYSGALDEFGDRRQIAENFDKIAKFAKQVQDSDSVGQTDIFGALSDDDHGDASLDMDDVPLSSNTEKLKWEKELLGLYVSGHPLRGLKRYISRKASLVQNLKPKQVGKTVKLVGLITNFRKIMTKAGTYMCSFLLEDPTARVNVVVFPRTFKSYGTDLADDLVVSLAGKLDDRRGAYQVICDVVKPISLATMIENAKEGQVFDPEDKSDLGIRLLDDILASDDVDDDAYVIKVPDNADNEKMKQLKELLLANAGDTAVELFLGSAKKKIRLPFQISLTDDLKNEIEAILKV